MNFFSSYRYRVVQKLLVLFAVVSLLPLAVLGGLTILNVQSSFTGLYRTMFLSFSSSAASEIDLFLNERLRELERLAHNPVIVTAAESGGLASEGLGLPELSIDQLEERYKDTKNLKVSPAAEAYLRGYQQESPFAEIFLTDRYGFNVSITQPTSDFVQSDESWWQEAKMKGAYISSALFDESANVVGLEMAVRVEDRAGGRFAGVIKGIFDLSYIDEVRAGIKFGDSGFATLVDAAGMIISHADPSRRMHKMTGSHAVLAGSRGEKGVLQEADPEDPQRRLLVAYAPLRSTGWVLLVRQDLREARSYLRSLLMRVGVVGAGVFVLILILGGVGAAWFCKPIDRLIEGVRRVSGGDFETKIDVASSDEIGQLATAFNRMTADLRRYVDDLRDTTAAKERIESELQVAHDIQMSMVPKTFPAFPDRPEFDLHATLVPAREVGGDFYDFFFIDDHRLCFAIGDVSGKGVPASLFMALTKTMFRATGGLQNVTAETILSRLNGEICRDNDSCMFVTVFCGILDIRTGQVDFSNAGHNLPYVLSGGVVTALPKTGGMALGVTDSVDFQAGRMLLKPGNRLVLYTDGVTEAMDTHDQLFSESRLEATLQDVNGRGSEEVIARIVKEVRRFTTGAPQSDDITLLVLRYTGLPSEAHPQGAQQPNNEAK